ncbi:YfhO family protein [bacterium]|nr:YfhO family protein [bacterium]
MTKSKKSHSSAPKSNSFEKWGKFFPYIILAIYLILLFIYFGSENGLLSGKKMLYGSDWVAGGYAREKVLMDYLKDTGELRMWEPTLFGGNTALSLAPAKYYYPIRFIGALVPVHTWQVYQFIIHLLLAGIGMYLLLRELKLSKWAGFIAGIMYMFGGTLISTAYGGHLGRTISGAFLPILFFFLLRAIHRRKLLDFLLFGLIGAVAVHASHTQLMYYIDIVLGLFLLFYLVIDLVQKNIKKGLKLVLYFALSVIAIGLLSAIIMLPPIGNLGVGSRGQERGYDYATSWSMPPVETFDLFVNDFSGGLTSYWGDNYFKLHSEYMGIIPILLAILGCVLYWRKKELKFFLGMTIVMMLCAFGKYTPFYHIPFSFVPMINKFRGPQMFFFLANFSIILLAGFGFDALQNIKEKINLKKILVALGVVCAALLLMIIVLGAGKTSLIKSFNQKLQQKSQTELSTDAARQKAANFANNFPDMQKGSVRSFFIALVFSILLFLLAKGNLKPFHVVLIFLPLFLFDTWTVDRKYLKAAAPPERYFAADQIMQFFKRDNSHYRVFPLHYQNNSAFNLHGVQSLGGYGPNPLARYQEFIGAGQTVMFNPRNLLSYPHMLNLLNTKYIVGQALPDDLSGYDSNTQSQIMAFKQYFGQFQPVQRSGQLIIYSNPQMLSRAFVVPDFEVAGSPEAALERVMDPAFNPLNTVVLEEDPKIQHPAEITTPAGYAEIENYEANHFNVKVNMKMPGFLVMSENYHPDWKAYVNGQQKDILIADYALRAVYLEKGDHLVEFKYQSDYLRLGKLITIPSLVILLGVIAFLGVRNKRNRSFKMD